MADIGGDMGDWPVVRSRKRKVMEQEFRGQDRARVPDWHRGQVTGYGQGRLCDSDGASKEQFWVFPDSRVEEDRCVPKDVGGRISTSEWHGTVTGRVAGDQGSKASFYVTNFPDGMPLFRLRQAFEVFGILTDVYVARHRNARGQEFGFVRYANVKNTHKLSQALNKVWIGDCRVLAREACFDRFAHNDVVTRVSVIPAREEVGKGHAVVRTTGEGVKNLREGNWRRADGGEDGQKERVGLAKEVRRGGGQGEGVNSEEGRWREGWQGTGIGGRGAGCEARDSAEW